MEEEWRERVELAKNKLILGHLYSTLLSFPPSQSVAGLEFFFLEVNSVGARNLL